MGRQQTSSFFRSCLPHGKSAASEAVCHVGNQLNQKLSDKWEISCIRSCLSRCKSVESKLSATWEISWVKSCRSHGKLAQTEAVCHQGNQLNKKLSVKWEISSKRSCLLRVQYQLNQKMSTTWEISSIRSWLPLCHVLIRWILKLSVTLEISWIRSFLSRRKSADSEAVCQVLKSAESTNLKLSAHVKTTESEAVCNVEN